MHAAIDWNKPPAGFDYCKICPLKNPKFTIGMLLMSLRSMDKNMFLPR